MAKISELRPSSINDIQDVERVLDELISKINELIRAHNETQDDTSEV